MLSLFDFCTIPWWLIWLLPFLLGLLVGWGIWSKYKDQVKALTQDIKSLREKIASLENDFAHCKRRRAELEGELALTKGRIRELEADKASGDRGIPVQKAGYIPDITSKKSSETVSGGQTGLGPDINNYPVSIFEGFLEDNLQVIEGIGPKMEEVLKENGVLNWTLLSGKTPEELNAILGKYGDKYRIIDPGTWPEQASLAQQGKWYDLVNLQKRLNNGKTSAEGISNSKVEKLLVKSGLMKMYSTDDLKAIEGIGPKIENLLKNAGISSWKDLSETTDEHLKSILDQGGPNFSLADPGTWPEQASMASSGRWKELFDYQEVLKGGKNQA